MRDTTTPSAAPGAAAPEFPPSFAEFRASKQRYLEAIKRLRGPDPGDRSVDRSGSSQPHRETGASPRSGPRY